MLNAVIRFSLRYRMLVVVISLTLLVYGSYLATHVADRCLSRPRSAARRHHHRVSGTSDRRSRNAGHAADRNCALGAAGVQAVRSQTTAGLNVIYVEFTWETEIRAARQTIQERLTTLGGVLPEGIRPQMTPPASIMGQIVIAGMYRQRGPSGGELAPIGKTGKMAELVAGSDKNSKLLAWEPVDRHQSGNLETPYRLITSSGNRADDGAQRCARDHLRRGSRSHFSK